MSQCKCFGYGAISAIMMITMLFTGKTRAAEIELPGTLKPAETTPAIAPTAGKITEVFKKDGQEVAKGDALASYDASDIKADLSRAEAALPAAVSTRDEAKAEVDRLADLVKKAQASAVALEQAQMKLAAAEQEVASQKGIIDSAKTDIAKLQIAAAAAGVVWHCAVNPGETVEAGKTLMEIYDPRQLRLEVLITRDNIDRVKQILSAGGPVRIYFESLREDRPAKAEFSRFGQGTSAILLVTPDNATGLRAGMTGQLKLGQ